MIVGYSADLYSLLEWRMAGFFDALGQEVLLAHVYSKL